MCKMLLYGEDTEIHMAGENGMKRLEWMSVEDYGATPREVIIVSAMKGYLRRMEPEQALREVEAVIQPQVIQLFGVGGAPMPVQSNVDGAKFAAFIDAAVEDAIRELEQREDDLSGVGVMVLRNVVGKKVVETMSPEFVDFIQDAYRSLRWGKNSGGTRTY